MSCFFIVSIEIFDIRLFCFIVREGLFHIGNQHSKLCSPISDMICSSNIVSHILKNSADRLANDGASKMAYMHFFGNIRRRKINNNILFSIFRERKSVHQIIHSIFNEFIIQLNLKETFIIRFDWTYIFIFKVVSHYLLSEFNNWLASKASSFLFILIDIKLFHGRWRNILTFSFRAILNKNISFDSKSFVKNSTQIFLDDNWYESSLCFHCDLKKVQIN